MNRVSISAEEVPLPAWAEQAETAAERVVHALNHHNWDVSILVCGNEFIQNLNQHYRKIPEPTDVLSFSLGECVMENDEERFYAGDIVISLPMLAANAAYFNVSEDEELKRLIVHGILHLEGRDHATNNTKAEPMLVLQEKILEELQNKPIIQERL